jgi:hypothetical protein
MGNQQQAWYAILFIVALVLLLRYFPTAGYGLAAIALLVILLRMRAKGK